MHYVSNLKIIHAYTSFHIILINKVIKRMIYSKSNLLKVETLGSKEIVEFNIITVLCWFLLPI